MEFTLSPPDINENDRAIKPEIVVAPLAKRHGRCEVRGASGILLVASSRSPYSATRLLTQGYDPSTALIMRDAAGTVLRRSTIAQAASLAARLAPMAGQFDLTADDVPTGYDEVALIEFLKCLRSRAVPDAEADELVAYAFPEDQSAPPEAGSMMVPDDTDIEDAPATVAAGSARVAARFAASADALPEPPSAPPPSTPAPVFETKPADGPVEGVANTDNIPEPSTATPKTKLRRLDRLALNAGVSDAAFRATYANWRDLRSAP
jgi:hypothetical protein